VLFVQNFTAFPSKKKTFHWKNKNTKTTMSQTSENCLVIGQLQTHFEAIQNDLMQVEKQLLDKFMKNQTVNENKEQITTAETEMTALPINPIHLLERVRALQENIFYLEKDVTKILQAKKEAIDITRDILLQTNRKLIMGLTKDANGSTIDSKSNEENFNHVSQQVMTQYNRFHYGSLVEQVED
jgi:3-oxoacyl-ACP reductase-like protein